MSAAELLPLLPERALIEGRTPSLWPGLSLYRFDHPVKPHWDEVQSLSLCLVVRGRKIVTIDGQAYRYDPSHYLVMTRQQRLQADLRAREIDDRIDLVRSLGGGFKDESSSARKPS